MRDFVTVTGMVLHALPIGEYDKRVLLLTKERGKISAFAKGARRQNSRLMAGTNPFSFGIFRLYEGRSSYNIMEVNISNYFEELREDFESAYLGMYFLEFADYYARENNDEKELLKLLYQSIKALGNKSLKKRLVRYIYELKIMTVNGEFSGPASNLKFSEAAAYTIDYIVASSIEKLYTFTVSDQVLEELKMLTNQHRKKYIDKKFKSIEIIGNLGL